MRMVAQKMTFKAQLMKCRRGETTDAMGRLKLGPMDASGFGEGL